MIVPLSVSFSGDFDALRKLLYSRYRANWFSHYGRIPAALFAADVRVRNTIHIGELGAGNAANAAGGQYTSRLHRWFEAARPHLLATLSYSSFTPERWKHRIPKLNTQALIAAFEQHLAPAGRTVESHLSRSGTPHKLHFKKTAYNWLSFSYEEAPCYDAHNKRVPQTKYGDISFASAEECNLMFHLLNGKLQFSFWLAIGDDFDVTKWMFADLPLHPAKLTAQQKQQLQQLTPALKSAVEEAVQYKLNAGKRVGNYNLAKCRRLTDLTDRIYAQAFGMEQVWDDIELLYTQTVKTNFEDDTEIEDE